MATVTTETRRAGTTEVVRPAPVAERPAAEPRHDMGRSLAGLLRELTRETTALVRAEVALARSEIEEKVTEAERGVSSIATGAAVLFAGVLALVACAILALSLVWPAWVSALVIGLAVCVIGGVLLYAGRKKMSARGLKPQRTIASLHETRTMAKEQVS